MVRIMAAVVLAFACLLDGGTARAGLRSATKGGTFREEVRQRLCYAGRFKIEQAGVSKDHFSGRFLELVPSCEGHPNANLPGEVRDRAPRERGIHA